MGHLKVQTMQGSGWRLADTAKAALIRYIRQTSAALTCNRSCSDAVVPKISVI